MTTVYNAYDELAEILALANPVRVLQLKASKEMQARLEFLIQKSKESQISKAEKDELDHYIVLERLIRLAKIRTRAQQA